MNKFNQLEHDLSLSSGAKIVLPPPPENGGPYPVVSLNGSPLDLSSLRKVLYLESSVLPSVSSKKGAAAANTMKKLVSLSQSERSAMREDEIARLLPSMLDANDNEGRKGANVDVDNAAREFFKLFPSAIAMREEEGDGQEEDDLWNTVDSQSETIKKQQSDIIEARTENAGLRREITRMKKQVRETSTKSNPFPYSH